MILTDVTAIGLNEFIVNDVDFRTLDLTFNIDLTIPELIIWGQFTANGLMAGVFPMNGNGPFKYNIRK